MYSPILFFKLICGFCFLFLFINCAATTPKTKTDVILPEIDVIQVKENSEEALKIAQETKLDVDVIQNKLIEIDNKLISLSEDVSSISVAKIEEIENRLSLLVEAFKDLKTEIENIKNSPYPSKTSKGVATFSPTTANIISGGPEYETYQNALRVFNSRNYQEAQKLFMDIIKQYPSGMYLDNSWYWAGECSYAMQDFAKAISLFQKVFDFPSSSKADDAQLKIALCYLKMGQNALAKTEFKKLIERYPASEHISKAQKYLSEIK
jgi:tol-pal system protein YbgF